MDDPEAIATFIKQGAADSNMQLVWDAMKQRQTLLDALAANELSIGSRVRVIPTPGRPHASDSKHGTVTKINRTTIYVTLDDPARGSTRWRFGASQLECLD